MGHLGGHADTLAQGGMRMNGFANVDGIGAHLDGQRNLANHVARVRTHDAATQDLPVAVGLRRIIKEQLGETFVATIGNGTTRRGPGEQTLLDLDALGLGLVLSNPPRPLRGRCRPRWESRGH